MAKKQIIINIDKCHDCPHVSHTGAFTKGGAKPCCNHRVMVDKSDGDCFKRVIPYKLVESTIYKDKFDRVPKRIPDWCPL